jgi:hypothetical protein
MQQLLVAILVSFAAVFAAWRLVGIATRLRLLDAVARRRTGVLARRAANWARRLRTQSGGCAGCAAGSAAGKRPAGR